MSEKILFVDDEANVLSAVKRQLRKHFKKIDTALTGATALDLVKTNGPYAVVVSDMRMPVMDGVEFLSRVKEIAPETVRMMLTGNADQETAIKAVNEGCIFRFLNKPCAPDLLKASIEAGIEQYRLIIAERELLNKTLNGSIRVMAEILSQVNPLAFSRSSQIKHYVIQIARRLRLPSIWQFSIAAFLSQIGCVTVPNNILEKVYSGKELDPEEEKMFQQHPDTAAKILSNIPRLENVSRMIALQNRPFSSYARPEGHEEKLIHIGGQILKIAVDFDHRVFLGAHPAAAIQDMRKRKGEYNLNILETLSCTDIRTEGLKVKRLKLGQVLVGMILHQDLKAGNGLLLASKGQEITWSLRERLLNFSKTIGVQEPFEVLIR